MHPCSTWHAPAFNRIYRRLVIVSAKQIVDRLRAAFICSADGVNPAPGVPGRMIGVPRFMNRRCLAVGP
jgi:hypothetical protein